MPFACTASMMSMRRMLEDARAAGVGGQELLKLMQAKKDEVASPVSMADFEAALKKVSSSVGDADLKKHEDWMHEFGAA